MTISRSSRSPITAKVAAQEVVKTNWLFVFVGAVPRTDWLPAEVARDERGFVVTGQDLRVADTSRQLAAQPRSVHPGDEHSRRVRRG